MEAVLTMTERGQVTLRKELRERLDNGIRLTLDEIKKGIEDAYADSGAKGLR